MAWNYQSSKINAALIVAPNGVHINWVRNELPAHTPCHILFQSMAYSAKLKVAEQKQLIKMLDEPSYELKVLAMNIEALRTANGFAVAKRFLNNHDAMFILDEGSIIKNHSTSQTKQVLALKNMAKMKRLLNGTPVTQSPLDIFPQFLFLDDEILQTTNYYAFRNEYAVLETQGKMLGVMKSKLEAIAGRMGRHKWGDLKYSENKGVIEAGTYPLDDGSIIEFTVKQTGRMGYTLKWKHTNSSGQEMMMFRQGEVWTAITGYKQLDRLQSLIRPYSDRVLRSECFDLPDKVYQKRYVELSEKQHKLYKDLSKRMIAECNGKQMTVTMKLTMMLRLQQIVGGFFTPDADGMTEEQLCSAKAEPISPTNPRIDDMVEDIDEFMCGKKIIIWARFRPELEAIAEALEKRFGRGTAAVAHGGISPNQRQNAIDSFRDAEQPLFLVANPQAKGVSRGQDMSSADFEIYYSNSFSLEDRLQSEDRPCSSNQKNNLGIIDIIAPDTVDEHIVKALRSKKDVADQVTGDDVTNWI
jgi:SNF2 family DNA or RNA helicase